MRVQSANGKWWVAGNPDPTCPNVGPYNIQIEAQQAKAGLVDYYENQHDPRFWTTDKALLEPFYQQAELWFETEYDSPVPDRSTLQWEEMFDDWVQTRKG